MILTEEQQKQFEAAAMPLIMFLNDHCDPHAVALVTSYDAELKAGVCGTGVLEIVKD